jgi:hypothetical protein
MDTPKRPDKDPNDAVRIGSLLVVSEKQAS